MMKFLRWIFNIIRIFPLRKTAIIMFVLMIGIAFCEWLFHDRDLPPNLGTFLGIVLSSGFVGYLVSSTTEEVTRNKKGGDVSCRSDGEQDYS